MTGLAEVGSILIQDLPLHLKSFLSQYDQSSIAIGDRIGSVFGRWVNSRTASQLAVSQAIVDNSLTLFLSESDRSRVKQLHDVYKHKEMFRYNLVELPDQEAANLLYINGRRIRRANMEYPTSGKILQQYDKKCTDIEVLANELAKVDGALSCCALFF